MGRAFTSYRIEERSYVAYLKREIHNEIVKGKFTEMRVGEIDIIVSEICSNLVKHAGGGDVLYRIDNLDDGQTIFEILAIDNGPGIADVSRVMKDGVSSTMTLGHGLGAIDRLSDVFQIYSQPAWGTVLYSKVSSVKPGYVKKESMDLDVRVLNVPKPRETACGDGYRIRRTKTDTRVFFGDGLGHGPHAEEAVKQAGDFFFGTEDNDPVSILREMHEKVRKTRGLVGTVAILDRQKTEWRVCGIGNILTRLYHGISYKNYMSYNGTIGLNIPNSLSNSVFPAERNQQLFMTSDGIRTRWDLTKFPSILKYDNMILAAAVYKDFNRANDDSSLLVAKVS
jgi:anti-sigma regulatory factor (Ser/Thr protein kinase)